MSRAASWARRYGIDALVVLVAIEGAFEAALQPGRTIPGWLAVAFIVGLCLPLLWRRRFPVAAPMAIWVIGVLASFFDGRLIVTNLAATVAGSASAMFLGYYPDGLLTRIGLGVVVSSATVVVVNDPSHALADLVFVPGLFAIWWVVGSSLRTRAVQVEAAEERAAHAERQREATARVAVAEERSRIARELHDIVAHAMAVMVLQVGAVRHRLPSDMAENREALRGVEDTGRAALHEMRQLLSALRDDGGTAELEPHPGLSEIESLADGVRMAGLPVHLHVEGSPIPLPHAIDLSAYRIVQEGLTNSLKHSGASRADVIVRFAPDAVQLEVRDDGVGSLASEMAGNGLVGIRERVKIYGGEMTAGAAPEGGYLLTANLPLGSHTP
jgi:signal transduction histidine kinase